MASIIGSDGNSQKLILLQHESAENAILLPMKDTGKCFRLRIRSQPYRPQCHQPMPQRIEHQVISHHELLGCKGIHHQQNGTYPATDAWQGRLLQDLVGTRQQMSDFCLQRPRAFTGTTSSTSILPISLSFWRRVKKRSITCPSTSPLPCTTVALLAKLRRVQKWAANWEDSGANWNSGCNAIMMWARRRLTSWSAISG